jgi:streptomycin 6-kinase
MIELPDEVVAKARLRGAEGEAWLADLPALVAELEQAWRISVGRPLSGGAEALVAEAVTADGEAAVLKLTIRGQDPRHLEAKTLIAGAGRGYVRLLRGDADRDALLLERLGARLGQFDFPAQAELEVICRTLAEAWTAPTAGLDLPTGPEKAAGVVAFIEETWPRLGKPCAARTLDVAAEYAKRRAAAHDPARAVLAHGDAHAANALQVPGEPDRFRLIDPDGLVIEPAYDLAIPMREMRVALGAEDALAKGRQRCALLSRLTGVEPRPIWEWGLIERVSSGLVLLQIGLTALGAEFLQVADLWAEAA